MIELVEGRKHQIIKRDGRIETYNEEKMYRVLLWMADGKEPLAKELLKDIEIKVFDKISISKLFDEVIETAANKISDMYPIWDEVAKRGYLQKIYKEVWGIKRDEYPYYGDVLKKGVQYGVYNREIVERFSEEEIKYLDSIIDPSKDFGFSFGGLNLFMQKYVARHTKTKYLELPQHAILRVAIQLHYKDKNCLQKIKEKYDYINRGLLIIPTPVYLNAMKPVFNPTSCVLIQTDDDSESITETFRSMAMYSKNASGLGMDITRIRAIGSPIGTDGVSSGVIPFIQDFEAIVKSWNQKSARVGAAAIYYPWWHFEVENIIMLKDAGGQDSERARALKYAIKWNKYLTRATVNDEEIYLFDPKEVPMLIEAHGEEFNEAYEFYKEKADRGTIKKKKIRARDLAFLYMKVYSETGNNYWFNSDAVNSFRVQTGYIPMSNLCTEVLSANKPLKLISNKYGADHDTREYSGEIGICNLSSINAKEWDNLSEEEKDKFTYNLLLGMDNAIEVSYYDVKAGERFNRKHRALGIGVTNYHNWLASQKIKITDPESERATHELFESIAYYLTKNSIELAKERSRYEYFEGSLWSRGIFQHELYREHFNRVAPELNSRLKYDWDSLREDMMKYGVRFETLMAVAPGANSSLASPAGGLTESTEPIRAFKIVKDGTFTLPFLAADLKENREYYETCWEISNRKLLTLAAIRQKFVDQSQSTNLYYKDLDSALELFQDIQYAEKLGVKTLYYLNSLKAGDTEEVCESCSV